LFFADHACIDTRAELAEDKSPSFGQQRGRTTINLARTVVKAPKSSHITPILRSLHWLKINERIEYKLLSLAST